MQDWLLSNVPILKMNISRWISNHQAAADRATRVIDAIREGSIPPIQRELAEEVMLCGRVSKVSVLRVLWAGY